MKIKSAFFLLFFLYTSYLKSQGYNVIDFQKINEVNGGFTGILDIDDSWGISIDNIGDLDGNGVNDLAVGAFADDDGGFNKGAVWILFLDTTHQVISHTKISNTSGGFTGILDNDDRFGGAVSYLGDINNDGLIELAVGADYDGDGGFWHGAVWILSLNTDGTVNAHAKISDTQGGFTGFINGDAIFGTDIENIGDIDGDGVEDLAVGSRRDGDGGARRGAVWILFMNSNLTVKSFQKISSTQGGFSANLEFEDYFGGSVANIGDLDGDGITDIAVGAYRDDDALSNSGSFYILFLNNNGTVKNYKKVSNLSGNLTSTIGTDALFGESIDGVTDIDNDGKIEIIVGALRERNNTLSTQTGAFYIIELNTDGTVSEDFLYTYGENCFNGSLEQGDFFGGSVTVLNNNSGETTFAIGAYKDRENGGTKGAVWILKLGEKKEYQSAYGNTSSCGLKDGSIEISELMPNTNYTISYTLNSNVVTFQEQVNAAGEIEITGLSSGVYENIKVNQTGFSCINVLDPIEIKEADFVLEFNTTNPTSCIANDGTIKISKLTPNTTYTIDYFKDAVLTQNNYTSNSVGEIIISSLEAGDYEDIMVVGVDTACSDGINLLQLEALEFNPTVVSFDTTQCGLDDGKIEISNLETNTNYTIFYSLNSLVTTFEEQSNSLGEIEILNLSSGAYENLTIEKTGVICKAVINRVELFEGEFDVEYTKTNPTSCNSSDGSFTISKLPPNKLYVVDYFLNSVLVQNSYTSNLDGEITISNLESGAYENIMIVGLDASCSNGIGLLELETTTLNPTITFFDTTSCGLANGMIEISGLETNTNYTISYSLNTIITTFQEQSNSTGEIQIENLNSGIYSNVKISEIGQICEADLNDIEIKEGVFNVEFDRSNPTSCNPTDGSIKISQLIPNTSYKIAYTKEGVLVENDYLSDSLGEIILSSLASGIYENVTVQDTVSLCSEVVSIIEIESIKFTPAAYATNSTSCNVNDGTIVITDVTNNEVFTISFEFENQTENLTILSNNQGELLISDLKSGNYKNILVLEVTTGCTADIPELSITCVPEELECFKVKNYFTPNNDGYNDTWFLEMLNSCDYIVFIYDRFGKELARLTPSSPSWNGIYNGKRLPSNDYWYLVEYTNNLGEKKYYKSHFALRRL